MCFLKPSRHDSVHIRVGARRPQLPSSRAQLQAPTQTQLTSRSSPAQATSSNSHKIRSLPKGRCARTNPYALVCICMGLCARVCTRKSVHANLHTRLRMYGLVRVSQYVRLAQGHGGAAVVFPLALDVRSFLQGCVVGRLKKARHCPYVQICTCKASFLAPAHKNEGKFFPLTSGWTKG